MNDSNTLPVTCYIGLGGNIGNVVATFKSAIGLLNDTDNLFVHDVSPVYKTPPWGVEDQDWFHNACAKIETPLAPLCLLELCKQIERDLHRKKSVRWGPRTIDLDILLYGDQVVNEEGLTIPHAQMLNRAFVLKPLIDIAPQMKLKGKGIERWLAELDAEEIHNIALAPDWWRDG